MTAETFLNSRVTLHCAICAELFTVDQSRIAHGRGKHCSPACQYEARRRAPKLAVAFKCIGCGTDFTRARSVVANTKGSGKYCTRACRDLHWVGKNNPNFQNGDKVYKRGPRWHSIRRAVLARDGYQCRACGDGGHLHVHHIIPFRAVQDKDSANHPDNLVSLCPPCHRKEDAKYKWIVRPQSGWALMIPAGPIWEMAKERGCI